MVKKILIARLSLAAVLVFTIPFLAAAASESLEGTEEGITMMVGTTIPPIDAMAPAKIETATFALG